MELYRLLHLRALELSTIYTVMDRVIQTSKAPWTEGSSALRPF